MLPVPAVRPRSLSRGLGSGRQGSAYSGLGSHLFAYSPPFRDKAKLSVRLAVSFGLPPLFAHHRR